MSGPPVATPQPYEHEAHGVRRSDPYHWMRRLDAPVLAHLAAEREWYDVATGHLGPLAQTLRAEMTGRVPATDSSVSWPQQGYSYYTTTPEGREFAQFVRRRLDRPDAAPELLLDANALAEGADGSAYVELGLTRVSPDGSLLAYSVDLAGDEEYELRFRSLETGEDLDDVVAGTGYGGAWSADSTSFFYTTHDPLWRQHRVWLHRLGTPRDDDVLVLEEADERFEVMVRLTRSGELVVIWSESRDTSEVWVVPASAPRTPPVSVGGRRRGVQYHAEHARPAGRSRLLVVTDDGEPEFRLMTCPVPVEAQDPSAWVPARTPDPGERLESVDALASHVVLVSRAEGHTRIRLLPADDLGAEGVVVDPVSSIASVAVSRNEEFAASSLLVVDESSLMPPVWSDVDLVTGQRTERMRKPAPGFDPSAYRGSVEWFPAPDGTPVPATVLRHASTPLDGSAPCVMYGYGAYESVYPDAEWDPAIPSLLDRGVVHVHAHVRGGGEGGRRWWLDGRLQHKQHTFDDHLAVAAGLADGLVDPARIATRGLSAGGLLQGAVFSQRPGRWRAVVAEVPFVDVVTTMLDPSVPLTVNEWDEWGDPSRPEDHAWLLAYSPYDNLPPAGGRPDLLVTGAVHDARVMVWEPAKWVAALRASDPEWSPRCLFRVETGAGAHAGPAGRFAHLAYEAEVYAWLLDRLAADY